MVWRPTCPSCTLWYPEAVAPRSKPCASGFSHCDAAVQILSNNNISKLADCDGLSQFTKLEMLSLLDNPVTKEANYRLYVIRKCPALKHLDFRKVRQ